MKRMATVKKCQGKMLLFIFNVSIPVVGRTMAGPFRKQNGQPLLNHLLKVFKPFVAEEPFLVNSVVGSVILGLYQEVVQPVDEVGIAFIDGPG